MAAAPITLSVTTFRQMIASQESTDRLRGLATNVTRLRLSSLLRLITNNLWFAKGIVAKDNGA